MTPKPLRGAITQNMGNSAPTERNARIGQRKLRCAKPPLEGIVADTQIELPDTLFVQGGYRLLDDESTGRTMRPASSRVADAQEHKIIFLPDAKDGRNGCFVANQRRYNRV